eukprot:scaffold3011_cov290-Prasinococcus_capsulatus_cf.AAC.3
MNKHAAKRMHACQLSRKARSRMERRPLTRVWLLPRASSPKASSTSLRLCSCSFRMRGTRARRASAQSCARARPHSETTRRRCVAPPPALPLAVCCAVHGPVGAVDGLLLGGGVPPAVEQENVARVHHVEPQARRLERHDHHGHLRPLLEVAQRRVAPLHAHRAVQPPEHVPVLPAPRAAHGQPQAHRAPAARNSRPRQPEVDLEQVQHGGPLREDDDLLLQPSARRLRADRRQLLQHGLQLARQHVAAALTAAAAALIVVVGGGLAVFAPAAALPFLTWLRFAPRAPLPKLALLQLRELGGREPREVLRREGGGAVALLHQQRHNHPSAVTVSRESRPSLTTSLADAGLARGVPQQADEHVDHAHARRRAATAAAGKLAELRLALGLHLLVEAALLRGEVHGDVLHVAPRQGDDGLPVDLARGSPGRPPCMRTRAARKSASRPKPARAAAATHPLRGARDEVLDPAAEAVGAVEGLVAQELEVAVQVVQAVLDGRPAQAPTRTRGPTLTQGVRAARAARERRRRQAQQAGAPAALGAQAPDGLGGEGAGVLDALRLVEHHAEPRHPAQRAPALQVAPDPPPASLERRLGAAAAAAAVLRLHLRGTRARGLDLAACPATATTARATPTRADGARASRGRLADLHGGEGVGGEHHGVLRQVQGLLGAVGPVVDEHGDARLRAHALRELGGPLPQQRGRADDQRAAAQLRLGGRGRRRRRCRRRRRHRRCAGAAAERQVEPLHLLRGEDLHLVVVGLLGVQPLLVLCNGDDGVAVAVVGAARVGGGGAALLLAVAVVAVVAVVVVVVVALLLVLLVRLLAPLGVAVLDATLHVGAKAVAMVGDGDAALLRAVAVTAALLFFVVLVTGAGRRLRVRFVRWLRRRRAALALLVVGGVLPAPVLVRRLSLRLRLWLAWRLRRCGLAAGMLALARLEQDEADGGQRLAQALVVRQDAAHRRAQVDLPRRRGRHAPRRSPSL